MTNYDRKFYDKWYGPKVKAGCRLLDKHNRGWWHKIKTKKLDAQCVKNCILATRLNFPSFVRKTGRHAFLHRYLAIFI